MGDPALPEGIVELKESQYAFGRGPLLIQIIGVLKTFRDGGHNWVQVRGLKHHRNGAGNLVPLGELSVAVRAETLALLMRR